MRTIEEILETQKQCRLGESAVEIVDLAYKMRNGISLNEEEIKLRDAYFKRKR